MIDTPPSRECALHTCLPSGDRSMPSGPLPTGITVCVHCPPAPASIIETLSEPMLDVKMVLASRRRQHHVGAVLAGLELPVDLVGRRIVAPDFLVGLDREIQFSIREREAVRPAERRDVDAAQFLHAGDVDHRDRVTGRRPGAVVAGKRRLAVARRDQLVRSLTDGHLSQHAARGRIDDRERRVLLVQHEQPRRARLRGGDDGDDRR